MDSNHLLIKTKTMSKVKAIKDGEEREFTQIAWDLLGKDKNGYVLVPDEATKQAAKKADNETETVGQGNGAKPIEDAKKVSKDFTADGAVIELKKIDTIEALNEFAQGEDRENILNMIKKRDAEITEANKPTEEPAVEETTTTTDGGGEETGTEGTGGEGTQEDEYFGPYSNDEGTNVKEAIEVIDELKTVEEINNYVAKDEERTTVLNHQAKMIAELTQ